MLGVGTTAVSISTRLVRAPPQPRRSARRSRRAPPGSRWSRSRRLPPTGISDHPPSFAASPPRSHHHAHAHVLRLQPSARRPLLNMLLQIGENTNIDGGHDSSSGGPIMNVDDLCSSASTTTSSNRPTCSCATYPRSIAIRQRRLHRRQRRRQADAPGQNRPGERSNAVVSWPAEEWAATRPVSAEMSWCTTSTDVRDMSRNDLGVRCASPRSPVSPPAPSTSIRTRSPWSGCRHTTTGTSTNGGAYPERFVLPRCAAHLERRGDARRSGGCAMKLPRGHRREIRHLRARRATTTSTGIWCVQTLSDTGLVMCPHIGSGFRRHLDGQRRALDDNRLCWLTIRHRRAQICWDSMRLPGSSSLSEGGIG